MIERGAINRWLNDCFELVADNVTPALRVNSEAEGALLEEIAEPDAESRALLARVAERFGLTARGYHRVLRVARTIADLAGDPDLRRPHVAEAVSYRLTVGGKS